METKAYHHGLPPAPDPERQFPHYLLRALLILALLADGFIVIVLILYLSLTVFASEGSVITPLFSLSFTVLFFAIALPAFIITFLLFLGYKATMLKTPYD